MNFSDMLKNKKKNKKQEMENPESTDQREMEQELEKASEILSHQGDGNSSENIPASDVEDQITEEEKFKAELTEANNKYLRLYAEFDNYKRRTNKERLELLQTAGKDVLASMLPVVDDFDRALKSIETATDVAAVKEGVVLVQSKLKSILTQQGLKEMESIGTVFDAEIHEAITNIPAPVEEMKGKVIDEVEKGYYLHDKVIRFAKVIVGA